MITVQVKGSHPKGPRATRSTSTRSRSTVALHQQTSAVQAWSRHRSTDAVEGSLDAEASYLSSWKAGKPTLIDGVLPARRSTWSGCKSPDSGLMARLRRRQAQGHRGRVPVVLVLQQDAGARDRAQQRRRTRSPWRRWARTTRTPPAPRSRSTPSSPADPPQRRSLEARPPSGAGRPFDAASGLDEAVGERAQRQQVGAAGRTRRSCRARLPETTLVWRNSSRACGLEMCTSTTGTVTRPIASCSAYE